MLKLEYWPHPFFWGGELTIAGVFFFFGQIPLGIFFLVCAPAHIYFYQRKVRWNKGLIPASRRTSTGRYRRSAAFPIWGWVLVALGGLLLIGLIYLIVQFWQVVSFIALILLGILAWKWLGGEFFRRLGLIALIVCGGIFAIWLYINVWPLIPYPFNFLLQILGSLVAILTFLRLPGIKRMSALGLSVFLPYVSAWSSTGDYKWVGFIFGSEIAGICLWAYGQPIGAIICLVGDRLVALWLATKKDL